MRPEYRNLRPAVERKLQEYLVRRREFEQFLLLVHPTIKRAFYDGRSGVFATFDDWRESFEKEYAKDRNQGRESKVSE